MGEEKKRCVIETLVLSGSRSFVRVYIVTTKTEHYSRPRTQQTGKSSLGIDPTPCA